MIDKAAIEAHIRGILIALGDDPEREGLKDTPKRVAAMYEEVFEGMNYTNDELVERFGITFEDDLELDGSTGRLVLMKDIEVFSYCEHHLALMYNMKVTVAYLPDKKIIGLSKIARIADMVAKRLQLQERITSDVAQIMMRITETEDVMVMIEGEHSCMTTRGIKKTGAKTITTSKHGQFLTDVNLYHEFMTLSR